MGNVFEDNKKRFKRFPPNVSIKFRRLDLSGIHREQRLFNAVINQKKNVSPMGIFIPTQDLLEVDHVVELVFHFEPQNREIKSLAKVIWVSQEKNHEGLGVELYKISQDLYSTLISRAKRGNWVESFNDMIEGSGEQTDKEKNSTDKPKEEKKEGQEDKSTEKPEKEGDPSDK